MKSVATKLLISIGLSAVLFSFFIFYHTYSLTNKRVTEVVGHQASMALKFDLAIRNYVANNVRPLMYELVGEDDFIPETMSTSYIARTIFEDVRNEFPDYIIKFSSDNPRNPANQAGLEELKIIEYLNNNPQLKKWEGVISINGRQYMGKFSARRMRESCLHCHGDPKDAPASLIERYGSTAGFHRPIGEIIGLDTIAIPMTKINQKLWSESIPTFVFSVMGLFFFLLAITLAFKFLIINRLSIITQHFETVASQTDYSQIEPVKIKGRDEIKTLASSFNTLTNRLRKIYSSLDMQVKERTRELEEKNVQLQQVRKMESIGTLAGGIAHDFNNILGIIVGNTELAMDDVPEWNPARNNLKEIRTASMRARDVVKQILAFSRQSPQEMKPVRIGPIIKESLRLLRSSIPRTIEIQQDISSDSDTVLADPTQINQILINLCTNAAHAMRDKGGLLDVCMDNVELDRDTAAHFHDLAPGEYVKLNINDTGHGMDANVLERIFDPYFTTKKVGEGSGMGLSVVHGIVKTHGGDIQVESKLGIGTSIQVLFPYYKSDLQPEIEIPVKIPKGHERILFVDDEEAMVKAFQSMIERLGYEVTARTSSIEALDAFRANPEKFNLVITDFTMPNMTGMELAKELLKLRSDVPIILCTGYSDQINEDKAKGNGIRAFVMKPVALSEIAKTIRKALGKEMTP